MTSNRPKIPQIDPKISEMQVFNLKLKYWAKWIIGGGECNKDEMFEIYKVLPFKWVISAQTYARASK